MPKGVKIPDEKKMEILWDAAREGVPKAAKDHEVSQGAIYTWTYQKPEFFKTLKDRLRPVREFDAEELLGRVTKELRARFDKNPAQFKTGELIGLFRECWSTRERIGRMESTENALRELMEKIEQGHEATINMLNEAIPHLSTEACQHILGESESYDDSERNTDGEGHP